MKPLTGDFGSKVPGFQTRDQLIRLIDRLAEIYAVGALDDYAKAEREAIQAEAPLRWVP